jgi:hypothetical protein
MTRRIVLAGLAAAFAFASPVAAASDWTAVGRALGKEGTVQANGVYRVGLPRSDLAVALDGVRVKPALALGSWLAFQDMGDHAVVMGDLVLLPEEVNPVMKALVDDGIEITALHNHLLRATPGAVYMHVSGRGDAVKLAAVLHKALALSRTPMGAAPPAPSGALDLDTGALDRILGARGKAVGGVYQFSIQRSAPVKAGGMEVPAAMGSAIAINFQPTGKGRAAIAGDFVMTADEVNPVIRVLRAAGIEVTALHNHMLDDEPRLFFMHFWANDDAQKLARGLRTALDRMRVAEAAGG